MIKRKELVDYANDIKFKAYQCTKHNKNYIYLEAINALCQCGFAIRANKKANIEAFKLSEKAFDSMYQFGYEQFLKDTVEANLAIAYIYVLSDIYSEDLVIDFDKIKPYSFYSTTIINCVYMIISEYKSYYKTNQINNILFQIEFLADLWKIDLHYFIDKTLDNMEYNIKNRI